MDMKEIVVEELSSLESLGASVISLDGRMLPESRQFLLSLLISLYMSFYIHFTMHQIYFHKCQGHLQISAFSTRHSSSRKQK
jgi:hypothetical protein